MSIPNILSVIRLCLIPVFVFVFFSDMQNAAYLSGAIFLLAFFTDIADGYIARRFNMVTKLGRILDPLADKLMKGAAVVCLMIKEIIPFGIILVLMVKELIMLSGGMVMLRKLRDVPSSNVLGKFAEGYICVLTFLLIIIEMPKSLSLGLWVVALVIEVFALVVYAFRAWGIFYTGEKGKK